MAKLKIDAQPRTIVGKQVKKLRREGLLPAVLYGPAVEGVQSITVDTHEFDRVFVRAGSATLLDLSLDGATRPVLIHQVQRDATRRKYVHVDFLAPDMKADLTVAVPLAFTGEAPALRQGGVLGQHVAELQVRALPDRIPAALEVDLTALTEVGSQLTAGEIALPAGVILVSPAEEIVVRIEEPARIEEPEVAEAAESVEIEPTAEAEQTGEPSAAAESSENE